MKKLLLLLVLIALGLTACSKNKAGEETYFVSILPQKYFVEKVVGDLFDIQVLVKPGESPATYEPTTKQMIDLNKAKALFSIGVAFEDNLLPKLAEQYPDLKIIATDRNIVKHLPASFVEIFPEEDEHDDEENHKDIHHNHDAEHGHEHHGLDPHIWLSPDLVKIQVADIADYFIAEHPEHASYFEQNRDTFLAELDTASQEIEDIFQNISKREFLCFHPAWGYFADQFNLKQIPIEIEGKEPTPKEQKIIMEFAEVQGIKFIFVQAQFDQRVASSIAEQIGGSVILIDPLAENYLANLKKIANKLAESMEK
jgi:zinc transport system substrate-binding protein